MNNWSEIVDTFRGKWVALADDENTVLASALSLGEARARACSRGFTDPILFRVPDELPEYVAGYSINAI